MSFYEIVMKMLITFVVFIAVWAIVALSGNPKKKGPNGGDMVPRAFVVGPLAGLAAAVGVWIWLP